MDKADIEIKHGYGISNFKHEFIFDGNEQFPRQNTNIIYAQNGVMKSSFAKSMKDYSKGDPIKDHIFDTAGSLVMTDGTSLIAKERVFSVASFDNGEVQTQRMGNLLISEDLQDEYSKLTEAYRVAWYELMAKIKSISGVSSRDDFQTILEDIVAQYGETVEATPKSLLGIIKSNRSQIESSPDLVSKTKMTISGSKDAIKFAEDNQGIIQDLMRIYEEVKASAAFVRGKFDSGNANVLVDAISKSGYLEVDHELTLTNNQTGKPEQVKDLAELKSKLATDLDRILDANPGLKVKFNKMIKDLSTATRSDLKKMLEHSDTKDIILLMGNSSIYKRKLWEGYLKGCLDEADAVMKAQEEIEDDLKIIYKKAEDQKTEWDKVVTKFNKRFRNLPYEIDIDNKAQVLLEAIEAPRPIITYRKGGSFRKFKTDKERDGIARLLSTGERKALYLLNVMFEIEATQKDGTPCLIVLDDVVDSFDYKNKYAFLEYIYEVATDYDNVRLIVLTHNYDFFRLLQSRLFGDKYRDKSWFAIKEENKVRLAQAEYFNLFSTMRKKSKTDKTMWLAMIPFARNLSEYKSDDHGTSASYMPLTKCLHDLGECPTVGELKTILGIEIGITETPFGDDEMFHDVLLQEAERISGSTVSEINLPFNLVLSMATRILAERYMIANLTEAQVEEAKSNESYFTRRLYEISKINETIYEDELNLIDDVNLITPEHIHVNSFMYEPLLDIGFEELNQLYKDVKALS